MKSMYSVLLCFLVLSPFAVPRSAPTTTANYAPLKITDKITVDGRLDEPAWAEAPRATGFIQREPEEGEASERTHGSSRSL